MVPQSQQRAPRNDSKINLLISAVFHGLIGLAIVYFAAREGLLGKQLKKIAVEMVKEKPPEKPKEPEKPKDEPPKAEVPKVTATPRLDPPKLTQTAPPANNAAAPPAAAPPAADIASFTFDGGKTVETDPLQVYKGQVEYAFRSRWNRPEDLDDANFVAEVEIGVDRTGKISDPVWKKGSGDAKWDASVRAALAGVTRVSRPPPANFPPRILVRFDTANEPVLQ